MIVVRAAGRNIPRRVTTRTSITDRTRTCWRTVFAIPYVA